MPVCAIRPIEPRDDRAIAAVIRTVMTEFGAVGPGFSINDPEVDRMSAAYAGPRASYFVIEVDGAVAGGGGIAPLDGGEHDTCELKKMYLLPAARGLGQGRALLDCCLEAARQAGFARVYLETLRTMTAAHRLYERTGFVPQAGPLGATGHFGCDRWMVKTIGG